MKKKLMIFGAAALISLPAFAGTAFAGNAGDGSDYHPQGSECGQYHGAFGAFGKDYNFAGGADGQATGAANSAKGCQRNL